MSSGSPPLTLLLGVLALAGYQNRDKLSELLGGAAGGKPGPAGQGDPRGGQQGGLGGLLGKLGGSVGGAGAGGLLSGGLGDLVERFRQNGHGETADSWVKPGPNRDIAPSQLEQAIGPDVLATLSEQTGLSREELLSRLSKNLPHAVDQYTPDGRLPTG